MKARKKISTGFLVTLLMAFTCVSPRLFAMAEDKINNAKIEELTGAKGKWNEKEGVFKVSVPRSDLNIMAAGIKLPPSMGLTAWAAFKNMEGHTMVMGDIVLLEDQVNPAMDAALENGLEVTALHNHFFWDSPKLMFMHVGGMGDSEKLAQAIGKVFEKLHQQGKTNHLAAPNSQERSIHADKLDAILKATGETNQGVYKWTFGRTITMSGMEFGNAMGVNTWAAFLGTDDNARVAGDFAMLEDELQSVLKALRKARINVVAIHNHMTKESPRMMFLHYWGEGKAEDLARGVRSGLDCLSSR